MPWSLKCLLCGYCDGDLVRMQEHVMNAHGYTRYDLQQQRRVQIVPTRFMFYMPDGAAWLHAERTPEPSPRFTLGSVHATTGALNTGANLAALVRRHACGDWSEMDEHDRAVNERALLDGSRIMSAYTVSGVRFYVITEAGRALTTVLLPDEY